MQHYALTLDKFLDHGAKWHGDRTIASVARDGSVSHVSFRNLRARSNRLSGALLSLGLCPADCVATMAWNTRHHLEMHYGTTNAGLICHTLNPRLTVAQQAMMINEAADRVMAIAASLSGVLGQLLPLCPTIEHVLLLDEVMDGDAPVSAPVPVEGLDAFVSRCGAEVRWGQFDETAPAGLCFTSGTTGKPKGVLFTHRSNYLHTLMSIAPDAYCLTARDTILVAIPMFHANTWGLPFSAPAVGARLVLPNRDLDGASLARLIRDEQVTIACGVQTVWLGLLDHLDATNGELPSLKRVTIGGSKCPDSLIRRMESRLGVRVQNTWGMTEMSPLGTVESVLAPVPERRTSGRPPMGVDLKLTDATGATLPNQRGTVGHLKAKGAAIIDRYLHAEADALDSEGYFDTGDLAMLDDDGNLTICGRSKDLIKSGGEWINPAEIEEIVGRDARVGQVAVIGGTHPKWGERPVLVLELPDDAQIEPESFVDALRGKVADWWLPDTIVRLAQMPLAATGKIDKARLRDDFESGRLASCSVRASARKA